MTYYQVRYNKKSGGSESKAYLVETEDPEGQLVNLGPWEDQGDSVVLKIPVHPEIIKLLLKAVTNTCHDDGLFTHGHNDELKEVFDYLVSQGVMEQLFRTGYYYKVTPKWRKFVWLHN